jgi:hypothetical protein
VPRVFRKGFLEQELFKSKGGGGGYGLGAAGRLPNPNVSLVFFLARTRFWFHGDLGFLEALRYPGLGRRAL